MRRSRVLTAVLTIVMAAAAGIALWPRAPADVAAPRLSVADMLGGGSAAGYDRALQPRPFRFPEDHGPHPRYRSEWWYFTGNLDTAGKRHFGYQLTFFRYALNPQAPASDSAWATRDIYMAHFTLTDVAGKRFHAYQRLSRPVLGLAGARTTPWRVWLEDWQVNATGDGPPPLRLRAAERGVAIDLRLDAGKPPVPQGDHGLVQKGARPGNASYYYSLTRLPTEGRIRVDGEEFAVRGASWMDREWGTRALDPDLLGWDWLALQLSDGSELMCYRLRRRDGRPDLNSRGTFVDLDDGVHPLAGDTVRWKVLDWWTSPHSGARYPSRWRLELPKAHLALRPYLDDQELRLSLRYWEGAVRVEGTRAGKAVTGSGYVELVGYGD